MNYKQFFAAFKNSMDHGNPYSRSEIISQYTEGRTTSLKELTEKEVRGITALLNEINPAQQPDKADKMRKKIISMAHEMGWHTLLDGRWRVNIGRLNAWAIKYGYLHKALNSYKSHEIPKLVTQFESVYKSFLNKV